MSTKNHDGGVELSPYDHHVSSPPSIHRPTELQKRIDRQSATNSKAIQSKSPEAIEAQKAIAGIYGHGLHRQEQLVNYAFDVVERQTRKEDKEYLGAIARQTLEIANRDIARVSGTAADRIIDIVGRSARPEQDTRSGFQRALGVGRKPED